MSGYFKIGTIGDKICYNGETLTIRALWSGGVVCDNQIIIEGEEALKCIKKL
jgi:hypothetical protein